MHEKGWNPGAAKDYDEFNFGLIKFRTHEHNGNGTASVFIFKGFKSSLSNAISSSQIILVPSRKSRGDKTSFSSKISPNWKLANVSNEGYSYLTFEVVFVKI